MALANIVQNVQERPLRNVQRLVKFGGRWLILAGERLCLNIRQVAERSVDEMKTAYPAIRLFGRE